MSKYKTLIFDLDGTVVNTDELIAGTFLKLYDEIEPTVRRTKEELKHSRKSSYLYRRRAC